MKSLLRRGDTTDRLDRNLGFGASLNITFAHSRSLRPQSVGLDRLGHNLCQVGGLNKSTKRAEKSIQFGNGGKNLIKGHLYVDELLTMKAQEIGGSREFQPAEFIHASHARYSS